jgi:hypothetical protein
MLDENTQSTDVGGDSPAAVSESTDTTAPSVGQLGEQATERSGDVTAQPADVEAAKAEEGEATPPPAEEDPLEGLPSVDELERQVEQRVPYAQALLKLRTALEARNGEVGELKTLEPVKPLLEQHGGLETVQARLEAYDSLFTPVVNPETQAPELDDRGFQRVTARPFIERVDGENPGMAEVILNDLLAYEPDRGDGQKVPLWHSLLEVWGLDPNRLSDYRNIDALTPQPSAGDITQDELQAVPEQFRETYKSLPPGVRNDLQMQDEETRNFNLEAHKERFDAKQQAQARQEQEAQERQRAQAQAREYVAREQEGYVSQHLREGYARIMDDLSSKVTFSADPAENAALQASVGSFIFSLRDPDFREANKERLEQAGIRLGADFDEALAAVDHHLRAAKAFDLYGQKDRARSSDALATAEKNKVFAKLTPIALRAAKLVAGQKAAQATRQGQSLEDASILRPTPGQSGTASESSGILPPGMRADSPEANRLLYQRAFGR